MQQLIKQDPLVINGETTARFWQSFTAGFSLLVFLGLAFWNLAVRFLYLAFIALVVRTVISLSGAKLPYALVLKVGIYAFVPVVYLIYIIERIGGSFFLLQTLLLVVVWAIGMYAVLVKNGWDLLGPDRTLRAWRAVVGLPFLIVLLVDVFFSPRLGGWFGFFAGVVTVIVLILAGWLSKPSLEESGLLP